LAVAGELVGGFVGASARVTETETDGDDWANENGTNTDVKTRPNSSWDAFMAGFLIESAGVQELSHPATPESMNFTAGGFFLLRARSQGSSFSRTAVQF
jgi:hypothetical protein